MADVLPDQVRGTTFVGTYEGDALGGVGDAHAMTTLWTVERVYAGGPLPQRFSFQTPACAWVNLTPGSRYLFSTSVNGLGGQGLAAGQPSVADSLAWELLADGAVRLAPFDTYQVSDYDSEELRVISTFEDALWSVAPDAGDGDAPAPGSTTDFGCTASALVASPEQARGTTFVGTYLGDEVLPGPGEGDVRAYWSVQRVYAGAPLPELLTLRSNGCAQTTLEPGRRYLFSTADATRAQLAQLARVGAGRRRQPPPGTVRRLGQRGCLWAGGEGAHVDRRGAGSGRGRGRRRHVAGACRRPNPRLTRWTVPRPWPSGGSGAAP